MARLRPQRGKPCSGQMQHTISNKQNDSQQTKFKHSGQPSYVANRPLQQTDIDLIDMTNAASDHDGYRYAVSGVGILSIYGWAIPTNTNNKPMH